MPKEPREVKYSYFYLCFYRDEFPQFSKPMSKNLQPLWINFRLFVNSKIPNKIKMSSDRTLPYQKHCFFKLKIIPPLRSGPERGNFRSSDSGFRSLDSEARICSIVENMQKKFNSELGFTLGSLQKAPASLLETWLLTLTGF